MNLPPQLIAAIQWFRVAHPMRCYYCGLELVERSLDPTALHGKTRDHVIPRVHGGHYYTVPACYGCNIVKGEMSLGAFRQLMFGCFKLFFGEREFCLAQQKAG